MEGVEYVFIGLVVLVAGGLVAMRYRHSQKTPRRPSGAQARRSRSPR